MSIRVIQPGLLTTVQDLGRTGYQQFGVSVSGAMDPRSAILANLLVGNSRGEGVLESTMLGPQLEFLQPTHIALTGGDMGAMLGDTPLSTYRCYPVKAGDILKFTGIKTGTRSYLAVAGGLDLPQVMDSLSTDLKARIGGFQGRKLEKDDQIPLRQPEKPVRNPTVRSIAPEVVPRSSYVLRVVLGPQDDHFDPAGLNTFFTSTYTLTGQSDRMGCRLEGGVITQPGDGNIISDGIAFGAIQVPKEGKPIIMLADRQTTGGYPKIATVISADFRILGQLKAGDQVTFQQVTMAEAQEAYRHQEASYTLLEKILNQ